SGIKEVLNKLTKLKEKLSIERPLPSELVKGLRNDYLVKNTYHSNAIEGNTLTIYETKAIIEDGITIAGKSMREHLEAINHKQAIILTEEIVKNEEARSDRRMNEHDAIILLGIDPLNADFYSNQHVIISGANHTPPRHPVVEQFHT